jgi:DNA modification methylase
MDENVVYHADCYDIMSKMESNSVDMILTDIPYNGWRNHSYRM